MIDLSRYSVAAKTIALTKFARVQPRLFEALLVRFQTLDSVLLCDDDSLKEMAGLSESARNGIVHAFEHLADSQAYVDALTSRDIRVTTRFDEPYPTTLFELNDPPSVLFVRGALPAHDQAKAAVVGTPDATASGLELASLVSKKLVENKIQIISSFTGGIDSAAHLAAHTHGGKSFAVVDRNFDSLIDEELMPLAIDIALHGGLISEHQPEEKVTGGDIAGSSRLIAALSQAVIVVEIYEQSERVHDLLEFCYENGKLAFLLIEPRFGVLADEYSVAKAVHNGAIIWEGLDNIQDLLRSLV